ncbi:MAG TPA: FAD-binding oxidoreductase [Polyangiaceae bacterium]|nr:FAD-binding oxidoreductase [Polyangiaceae bacterium]
MNQAMPAQRFVVELIARSPLSSRVDRLRFAAREPFVWQAGQHLVVVASAGQALFLPYSVASANDPEKPGEFELAVAVHAGADVMDKLPLGAQLEVEGPAGTFTWQAAPSPAALLVGAGTGIAPLRALVEAELARPSETRVLLLAGHREPEDVLFAQDFARFAAQHPRFHFIPTLTAGDNSWLGRRGRVQAQLLEAVSALAPLDAYVCGRLEMVNDVVRLLVAHGVPESRIRSEGF